MSDYVADLELAVMDLRQQLAKANERVKELEGEIVSFHNHTQELRQEIGEYVILIAKANERVDELQDALIDDAKAKAMLEKLTIENGELNIKASGNIFHVFCETFVETFTGSGATNYLVAEFNSEELGAFTVTMQRSEGLTVYQKLSEANERVKELESNNRILNAFALLLKIDKNLDNINARSELNKFAMEQQAEGIDNFMHHFRYEYEGARDTDSIESFADDYTEQLRKEQENG
jgi:hypothetical protein